MAQTLCNGLFPMRLHTATAALLVSIFLAGQARAEGETPAPAASLDAADVPVAAAAPLERRWYGWQTLGVDASALALLGVGASVSSRNITATEITVTLAGAAYLFGAPLIHGLHDGPFGKSIALRILTPTAGFFAGALIGGVAGAGCRDSSEDIPCGFAYAAGGAVLGFGAGVLTAMITDAFVFAYEPGPSAVSLAPLLVPRGNPAAPAGATGLALSLKF